MSSPETRKRKQAEYAAEHDAFLAEERRYANLTFYEKVSELDVDYKLKNILHLLGEKAGLEL